MSEVVFLGGPSLEGELPSNALPNVVFIHGFGSDSQSWVGNAPALFSFANVWALDLPGHGRAWAEKPAATLEGVGEQIGQAVFSVSERPIHIVGHSIGGALAVLLAQRQPDKVASLVLISPAGLGMGVDETFINLYPQLTDEDEILKQLRRLVSNPRLIPDTFGSLALAQLKRTGVKEVLTDLGFLLLNSGELVDQTKKEFAISSLPRLVVWGKQDQIIPYNENDQTTYSGEWLVLDDCGHLPHVEHRVKVNNMIKNFLTELE